MRKASDLITNHLPSLLQSFKVLGSDQLKAYKLVSKPPSLNMNLSHGIDFLKAMWNYNSTMRH
ncbi:MAG: hypothetical protein R3B47_14420 [Bacteroidia bacterium]